MTYKPHVYEYILIIEEFVVHIYCNIIDDATNNILNESKNKGSISINAISSVEKHSPHTPKGQNHLHVYVKNNQIFSINKDGSAHDGHHGIQIPNKIYHSLKTNFPDFNLPKNKIIESITVNNSEFPFNEDYSNIVEPL